MRQCQFEVTRQYLKLIDCQWQHREGNQEENSKGFVPQKATRHLNKPNYMQSNKAAAQQAQMSCPPEIQCPQPFY